MKECRLCHAVRPLDDFPKRKSSVDGRRNECTPCTRAAKVDWNAQNKDKIREYHGRWIGKDPEKYRKDRRANSKRMRDRDPEKARAAYRKWLGENPDIAKLANKRWRDRQDPDYNIKIYARNAERKREQARQRYRLDGKGLERSRRYQLSRSRACPRWLTAEHRAEIREIYDEASCRNKSGDEIYHVDHIVPLNGKEVCGLHVPWNLQILTAEENRRKWNSIPDEIRRAA